MVRDNTQYALKLGNHECMEEHLNYINHYLIDDFPEAAKQMQLDFLIPIERK